jgi:hypothetical protein
MRISRRRRRRRKENEIKRNEESEVYWSGISLSATN